MDADPYRTPAARLTAEHKAPSLARSILGPVAGAAVDIVGTMLFGVIATTALALWLASEGTAPETLAQQVEAIAAAPVVYVPSAFIGLACLRRVGEVDATALCSRCDPRTAANSRSGPNQCHRD
ncbi:MAG: hypothetical protein ACT4NU_10910 [Chromatiales bacterium]